MHAQGCKNVRLVAAGPRFLPHARCVAARSGSALPDTSSDYVRLGATDLEVSRVGVGTLAWGDPKQGFGNRFDEKVVTDIFNLAVELGLNFFDSAEVYGYQGIKEDTSSECLVRRCAQQATSSSERPLVVGSKYFTIPWTNFLVGGGVRLGTASMAEALDASLARLGTSQVDLYQIHFPFPTLSQETLMDGLKAAVDSGKARAVGVCNYNAEQLQQAHDLLSKHNIPIASNQVEYSLLKRGPEKDGVLDLCRELNVSLIAHSPLKQGLLTDFALERDDPEALKIRPLLQLMRLIGQLSGGRTVEAVALNYLMCRGAIVIPGAKNTAQLQRNAGAMGWRMDENECEMISEKLRAMEM